MLVSVRARCSVYHRSPRIPRLGLCRKRLEAAYRMKCNSLCSVHIHNHQMREVSQLIVMSMSRTHLFRNKIYTQAKRIDMRGNAGQTGSVRFSASITLELIGRPRSYSVRTDRAEAILSRTCLHDESGGQYWTTVSTLV